MQLRSYRQKTTGSKSRKYSLHHLHLSYFPWWDMPERHSRECSFQKGWRLPPCNTIVPYRQYITFFLMWQVFMMLLLQISVWCSTMPRNRFYGICVKGFVFSGLNRLVARQRSINLIKYEFHTIQSIKISIAKYRIDHFVIFSISVFNCSMVRWVYTFSVLSCMACPKINFKTYSSTLQGLPWLRRCGVSHVGCDAF